MSWNPPPAGPVSPPSSRGMPTWVWILLAVGALAIVGVPTVGILAAIAIPNFVEMQYRAKRAEVPANVDGILTAELLYQASNGTFLPIPDPVPTDRPGRAQRPWPSDTAFDTLGWHPGGPVRGSYSVQVSDDGTEVTVTGSCDVDADGVPAVYVATTRQPATMQTDRSTF